MKSTRDVFEASLEDVYKKAEQCQFDVYLKANHYFIVCDEIGGAIK